MANFGNHVCGFYFTTENYRRTYLRPVKLESHTTINPVSFTTQLHQTFETVDAVPHLRYTFPLYDGVAVSGYSITYADKTLTGIVKQKDDAKKTYQAAVDRGETAGLLESLPAGVFGVTLGNVPAQTALLVEITYCGELKHDAAVDGLRYTLPTSIAPRYGSYPGAVLKSNVSASNMRITVDMDMGTKSNIRKVQSPSHPIAVTMGELSTSAQPASGSAPYSSSQASATLSQGSTELDGDFVLQVVIDDLSKPQAILEAHPILLNQRAIMTTLVPKFVLESANPEIVFIADQSGSMSGAKNTALVSAMKVFLKSLPLGVRFNICAFGNAFQFLWNSSQAYSEENVNRAIEFVNGFSARFGGTELLKPIKAAFERHLKDLPLEVMVLTDGEIWQENAVFQYINEQLERGTDARVFALGIGQDVSHTLVEGIARAGNGFAQFVTQNEDTDQKVIRMLKSSLYAHTKDYSLEVNYGDEDFELVEKVQDCLNIATSEESVKPTGPTSFFNESANLDQSLKPRSRYDHLPSVSTPKLLQAPSTIPPSFPFNRTTIYLLLDEQTPQKDIKSVTLRATSANGPLELEIPISGTTEATSIHQLAARKAIQELEEGRGWIHSASIEGSATQLVQQKYESRFDELVEREAVRLGEKFQVASKWTSFVAVQDHGFQEETVGREQSIVQPMRGIQRAQMQMASSSFGAAPQQGFMGGPMGRASSAFGTQQVMAQQSQQSQQSQYAQPSNFAATGALFGSSSVTPQSEAKRARRNYMATASSSGQAIHCRMAASPLPGVQVDRAALAAAQNGMADAANMPLSEDAEESDDDFASGSFCAEPQSEYETESDDDMGFGLFDGPPPKPRVKKQKVVANNNQTNDGLHQIINLQSFSGAWACNNELLGLLNVSEEQLLSSLQCDRDVASTALVIVYLEAIFKAKEDVWEMVVNKAKMWLEQQGGGRKKAAEMLDQARKLLPQD